MIKAEAFEELSKVVREIEKLSTSLTVATNREKELYTFLKLPHPSEHEGPAPRKRITKEKVIEIRRMVINVMRDLCGKGLTWLPMQLIVKQVNQELPDALESEIGIQVRFLAQSDSAPIEHNGQRGNGSGYTYTSSK